MSSSVVYTVSIMVMYNVYKYTLPTLQTLNESIVWKWKRERERERERRRGTSNKLSLVYIALQFTKNKIPIIVQSYKGF